MWATEYNTDISRSASERVIPTQSVLLGPEPQERQNPPASETSPLVTPNGKAIAPPQHFIDDVNLKGSRLRQATTGSDPEAIRSARKEYRDALMSEIAASFIGNDDLRPDYPVNFDLRRLDGKVTGLGDPDYLRMG